MSDPNPYQSPRTEPHQNALPCRRPQSNLVWIILPVIVACVLGFFLGPMFARGPGDPTGRSVGMGTLGALGLCLGILLRSIYSRAF